MKGVTLIIILSVVWSIISSIIEKKKAAAAKQRNVKVKPQQKSLEVPKQKSLEVPTEWKADPVQVKVESLRRRKRATQVAKPAEPELIQSSPKKRRRQPLKPLHEESCPLPPTIRTVQKAESPAKQLALMLRNERNLRTAIVLSEVLSKPISLRTSRI